LDARALESFEANEKMSVLRVYADKMLPDV